VCGERKSDIQAPPEVLSGCRYRANIGGRVPSRPGLPVRFAPPSSRFDLGACLRCDQGRTDPEVFSSRYVRYPTLSRNTRGVARPGWPCSSLRLHRQPQRWRVVSSIERLLIEIRVLRLQSARIRVTPWFASSTSRSQSGKSRGRPITASSASDKTSRPLALHRHIEAKTI